MARNMGTLDRILRIVVGLALIAFAIPLGFPWVDWNWLGWIGLVPLITAFAGSCPVYSLFGLTSHPGGTNSQAT